MKTFLKIAYLGTAYHGFQVQPETVTVEGTLQDAIEATFGKRYDVVGCSRTDSGVHAEGFCMTVETGEDTGRIPARSLPLAMNIHLPPDISVLDAREVEDSFHARYDVISKEYEYRIWNSRVKNPFTIDRAWHVPRMLDTEKMNRAAQALVGKHDFAAFMAQGSLPKGGTERTVYFCRVTRGEDGFVRIRIGADGYLYNMVRIIVGTLVGIAFGRFPEDAIPSMLASGNRTLSGMTAPPYGLYLVKVNYPDSSM